ncbi:MAG: hypothetical protein WAV82_05635 [Methylobacter sp.]
MNIELSGKSAACRAVVIVTLRVGLSAATCDWPHACSLAKDAIALKKNEAPSP